MKTQLFAALLESADEALAHAKGKRELRTTVLPDPPRLMGAKDVLALRERVKVSQSVFAHFLNVSTKLVQAWEADRRRPEGAALRLLELASHHPALVFRSPSAERTAPKRKPRRQRDTSSSRATLTKGTSAKTTRSKLASA